MLWRLFVRLNFTFPVAVKLKRFAAAFFVFNFGIRLLSFQ
jgi:hypothetical protein